MLLNLPKPPRYGMSRPPLVQALAQVNFPVVPHLETLGGVAPLQEALADLFPYMNRNRVQQINFMIGPTGPAATESAESWVNEFSNDEGWAFSVTATSASLSIGSDYSGVEDFADKFISVCNALRTAVMVSRCDRIGVRYLDVVETASAPDEWAAWFRPEVIGLAHPGISSSDQLLASITETRLHRPAEGVFAWAGDAPVEGIIRHGVVPAGALMTGIPPRPIKQTSFLLDMDTFMLAPQPFDSEALARQYRELHAEVEGIFHWMLTDSGKERFGYALRTEEE